MAARRGLVHAIALLGGVLVACTAPAAPPSTSTVSVLSGLPPSAYPPPPGETWSASMSPVPAAPAYGGISVPANRMMRSNQLGHLQIPAAAPNGWTGATENSRGDADAYEYGLYVQRAEVVIDQPIVVALMLANRSPTERVGVGTACYTIFQVFVRDATGREPAWQYRRAGTVQPSCPASKPLQLAPGQSLRVDIPVTINEPGSFWLGASGFGARVPAVEVPITVQAQ